MVSHCNAHPHCFEGKTRVITVHIGETRAGGAEHLTVDTTGKDVQFLPPCFPLPWRHCFDDAAWLIGFSVEILLHEVTEPESYLVGRVRDVNAKPGREAFQLFGFPDLKECPPLRRRSKRLDSLLGMIVICGGAHDIFQKHHAHSHSVAGNSADTPLVPGHIRTARSIGTQIAPDTAHTKRTSLVRIAAHALGFEAIPDVCHSVLFDTFVNSTDRLMM